MLGLVVTMMGPAYLLVGSIMDAMNAQREAARENREAAERAEWCAEHPEREWPGEGDCPTPGPRGYDCEPADVDGRVSKCVPHNGSVSPDDYTVIPSNATNPPGNPR